MAIQTTKTSKEREYACISAIISDNYIKDIYKGREFGYWDSIDIIVSTTEAFYKAFKKELENKSTLFDWEEIFEKHRVSCYDDLVTKWSGQHLKDIHKVNVKVSNMF